MKKSLFKLPLDSVPALDRVTERLTGRGLRVVRSFDLQSACGGLQNVCPHHGSAPCNCQMVVIVVSLGSYPPVSLVAHSVDGVTDFELVSPSGMPVDQTLAVAIKNALLDILLSEHDTYS